MNKLTRTDLYSLEAYAEQRDRLRAQVMAHKVNRRLAIGPHVNFYFEDRLTIQYQVQEMLRIERIFESAGIEEELESYNPLIPDGSNWKATMMIEIPDPEKRRVALTQLIGIEDRCYVEVKGSDRVFAIADEDIDRSTTDKTSSVHFLRFELDADMITALRSGAVLSAGVDLASYSHRVEPVPAEVCQSLLNDLS